MRLNPAQLFLRAALVLLFVFAVVAYLVARELDVVDKGRLLTYTSLEVTKVRAFDRFSFYASEETSVTLDDLDGILLVSISSMAFLVAVFLDVTAAAKSARVQWFFTTAWLGTGFLAFDELFGLHETFGHNLRFLADIPGVDHPDDIVLLAYALPALAFAVGFRDVVLASRRATFLFASTLLIFVMGVGLDLLQLGIEELVEPIGSGLLLAGFMALAVDHLRASAPPAPAEAS